MKQAVMLTAMHSGAGKTVMTCALIAAWKRRGLPVRSFKCGPDYIDPMFHSSVLGVPCRNLDLFLQGEEGVRRTFQLEKNTVAVLEGAMGYYDGRNGTTEASAWELAEKLKVPSVLVLEPDADSDTLAARINAMKAFRMDSRLSGILLNRCSERTADTLRSELERKCGLPVFGRLPETEAAKIQSRHLGLITAAEIADLKERFERLADLAEKTIDLDGLLRLGSEAGNGEAEKGEAEKRPASPGCRIAVARDEAFCFYYEDNLNALRTAGAETVFFSPIRDRRLPERIDGIYLGGGYPELYAGYLAENETMRTEIREALLEGVPAVAECGGFLYLQETLEDSGGRAWPMCALLPGRGVRTERLQRFGYLTLRADRDSLLLRTGETAPAHEFHYWDSSDCGTALHAEKANGRSWRCGYAAERLYAAFPHLHFGGEIPFAKRFVKACEDR